MLLFYFLPLLLYPLHFPWIMISTLVKFIVSTVIAGLCISIPIKKIKIVFIFNRIYKFSISVLLLLYRIEVMHICKEMQIILMLP